MYQSSVRADVPGGAPTIRVSPNVHDGNAKSLRLPNRATSGARRSSCPAQPRRGMYDACDHLSRDRAAPTIAV